MNKIEFGDCRDTMRRWAAGGVRAQTCVTSPPYFGLRDYGHDGQIGLEQTPEAYIAAMVEVFRCVRDVLADDGTVWVNIGDSYARQGGATDNKNPARELAHMEGKQRRALNKPIDGYKPKDLIGIPWMLAFALRADGWYLRQDIIWAKPNPMPESVRDRCTKAHEYIFLLSKSERYYFDIEAMKEPATSGPPGNRSHRGEEAYRKGDEKHRTKVGLAAYAERQRSRADSFKRDGSKREQTIPGQGYGTHRPDREESTYDLATRNRRSVWTVATRPYKGAHFATFPPALIEPCILAGSRPGDIVLDPFMGSGTTAAVAIQHGRQYLGCELNPEYGPLQQERIRDAVGPLFALSGAKNEPLEEEL
jgi:DNA modification methylase